MSRTKERYWVAKREGSQFRWLFDSEMPHEDGRMVYLFNVGTQRMNEYPKEFAKKVLAPVQGPDRDASIAAYEKWHAQNGPSFLEQDEGRRRRAILERNLKEEAEVARHAAEMEARRQEVIVRHKEYLDKHGKQYVGISENSKRHHRVTHCYACKNRLDSDLQIECQSCYWLICYCGACGCGYQA